MLRIGLRARVLAFGAVCGCLAASGACSGGSTNLFEEMTPAAGSSGSASHAAGSASNAAGNGDSAGATGAGGGRAGSTGASGAGGSHAGASGSEAEGGSGGAGGMEPALIVEYLCNGTAASNSTISFHLRVTNNGDADVPLEGLSVRYYLTNETEATPVVELDYGAVSAPSQNLTTHVASMCSAYGPKATASTVCEATLSSVQAMSPGGDLQLQLRIHAPEYQLLDQSNDYSFDPTKTAFAPWDHVTVHRGGTLLAGAAP